MNPRPVERAVGWPDAVFAGAAVWYGSALVVLLGAAFGHDVLGVGRGGESRGSLAAACVRFDGLHYQEIAERGYSYNPAARSTVAFFPAYPLAAKAADAALGEGTATALIIVSNSALVLAFALLARYAAVRPLSAPGQWSWVVWAAAVWPASFFFRMAYAESLFVLMALVALYGIARRWPLAVLAAVAGLAAATRPVGVAVSAAVLWHAAGQSGRWPVRLGRVALLAPLACWGLLGYMGYQAAAFGDPLAFARTQQHWTAGAPDPRASLSEKAAALATLEPARGVYDAESTRYWGRAHGSNNVLFNLAFWNPILFALAAGLVALGAARRWLIGPEVVFGACALGIPYVTRAYEMSMASHARFAAAVVPAYLVAGRLLAALPQAVAVGAIAAGAALLSLWTALYVAGYAFF